MTEGNMRIWEGVSKTNPANTKTVNQRGGFTAINAHSQVMEATRQFGPIGIGWGYIAGDPIFHDTLLFVQVTLWHGDRGNTFGPMLGCEEWKDAKGRVDSDAGKKATTDAVTKLLSHLGFNADVFLGMYDDNKYVERLKKEFAEPAAPVIDDGQWAELSGLIDATGTSSVKICEGYGIASLRGMTVPQYEKARAALLKRLPQPEEKAA